MLNLQLERLQKLARMRKDFVANVSHELKTPITAIKGFAEALDEGAKNNHEQLEKFIAIIRRQTDRVSSLIEDLLTLSRLEHDDNLDQIHFEETDISRLVQHVVQDLQDIAATSKIAIDLSLPDSLLLYVSGPLLEQAIFNLISNAIKYSDTGSIVRVVLFENEERVVLEVKDAGCGIAKEHISRIFERFYRVDRARSRKEGGTGLGLAIVKHISQLHFGYARVESSPGHGSNFSIHLPKKELKNLKIEHSKAK